MAKRQPHYMLILLPIFCTLLLPQCAKKGESDGKKRAKITRRRSRNTPKPREVTRGLATFKEAAAEDKRYRSDEYDTKGPAWYRGMSFAELKKKCIEYENMGRWDLVVKYLDRLIKLSNDQRDICKMRLEMADAMYKWGEYERASRVYTTFAELYPGSEQSEYASYKAILCHSKLILAPDRDTSAARAAVRDGQDFLKRKAEGNIAYNKEVAELIEQAHKTLYMSEMLTFYFYLNSGSYLSAQGRLEYIKKEFADILPEFAPEIIVLEFELAAAINDKELIQKKKQELKTKYPKYKSKEIEKEEKRNKTDYVKKF
ncbi:MAG TPA: outer membrane protein assembly factor BamD [Candidatus Babeliales bacterium]|nr:outer membrane protein assembly factor BamD [Candidatus Babeliales bacterium]